MGGEQGLGTGVGSWCIWMASVLAPWVLCCGVPRCYLREMVTATRAAPVLFLKAGGHWLGGVGHLGSLCSSCQRGRGHSGGAGGALGPGLLGRGWQQTPSPCWRSPASSECSATWWQGHSGRSRWCTCHVPGVALMLLRLCQLHLQMTG